MVMHNIFLLLIASLFILTSCVTDSFKEALHKTQHCSNPSHLYVSIEGGGSGLGSQFHYYFVHALKDAILNGQRMIYVTTGSGSRWENDCKEHR